ncbi:hypothetical protein MASR1M50_15800 [Burkholderiales bacterium]
MNTGRLLKWAVMDGSRAHRARTHARTQAREVTVHCKARRPDGPGAPAIGPPALPARLTADQPAVAVCSICY